MVTQEQTPCRNHACTFLISVSCHNKYNKTLMVLTKRIILLPIIFFVVSKNIPTIHYFDRTSLEIKAGPQIKQLLSKEFLNDLCQGAIESENHRAHKTGFFSCFNGSVSLLSGCFNLVCELFFNGHIMFGICKYGRNKLNFVFQVYLHVNLFACFLFWFSILSLDLLS